MLDPNDPYLSSPELVARVTSRADQEIARQRDEARLAHLMTYGPPLDAEGRINCGGVLDGLTAEEVRRDREAFRRIVG